MLARKKLTVTIENGIYLIDGFSSYDFDCGIEYVLQANENIWLTWNNISNNNDLLIKNTTSVFRVPHLTTGAHHKYATDNLIYWSHRMPLYSIANTPIGLIENFVDAESISTHTAVNIDEELLNRIIVDKSVFNTNSSKEEILNILPDGYIPAEFTTIPLGLDPNQEAVSWESHQAYLAVINFNQRLSNYSVEWTNGTSGNFISFDSPVVGPTIIKTDLMHYTENNGSKEITFTIRPGDERTFYLNNADRSNTDFLCRGHILPENKIYIRKSFDEYLLFKYPKIYELLLAFIRIQTMRSEPMSYLNNMTDYWNADKMPAHLLQRALKGVFSPFESSLAEDRNIYKRISDFTSSKGNINSYSWLANTLFKKPIEVKRFYELVFALSSSDWKELTLVHLLPDDLPDINVEGKLLIGKSSAAVAVIESVKKVQKSGQDILEVCCVLKQHEFDSTEELEIDNVIVNALTLASSELGISSYKIENAGTGYRIGQQIISSSTTGEGFLAYIAQVNSVGGITAIDIKHSGWFYRDYQHLELEVYADHRFAITEYSTAIPFVSDLTLTYEWTIQYRSETITAEKSSPAPQITLNSGTILNKDWFSLDTALTAVNFFGSKNFVMASLSSIDFRSSFDSLTQVPYVHPSEPLAMYGIDETLVIAYADRVDFFNTQNLEDSYLSGKAITVHTTVHTGPGAVTGVGTFRNELFVFDTTRLYHYKDGILLSDVATPVDFSNMRSIAENGIITHYFFGLAGNYKQSFIDDSSRDAKIFAVYGRSTKIKAGYSSQKSTLSSNSKLNDNLLVTPLSLVTKIDETIDTYSAVFKETLFTSGFKTTGLYIPIEATVETSSSTISS